ncbi:MAG: heparinase II/III family protein [Oscillospiraceae bacterium]
MLQHNFWCDDYSAAAGLLRRQWPRQAAEIIALADEICQKRFTFRGHWEMERTHEPVEFAGEINWEQVPAGDAEWVYAFNRHSAFVTLGQAWRLTGRAAYAGAFCGLLQSWLQNVPLTPQSRTTTWRSIEAGLRCESWLRAAGLFNLQALLSEELFSAVLAGLRVHAEYLLEAEGTFQQLSNWGVLQNHGLFLLGLALNTPAWCETAVSRLTKELHLQVMADGTHWEQSPLYHCEVLHCCLNTMLAARRAGYALPNAFVEKAHAMAGALAVLLRPDGKLVCQGDSDEVDARDLVALAALLFADKALKGAARGALYPENLWDFTAAEREEYEALGQNETALQSAALPCSGNYQLRTGPGEEAGFLHFYCGSLGSGHGHAALLHADLVAHGETVLADSGRYTYVNTPLRRRLKSPAAHNTATVDGLDFSVPGGSWGFSRLATPLKGEHRFTPPADYAAGSHLGYMQQGVLSRRQALRLGQNLWVLCDSFFTRQEASHTYRHYYHFGAGGHLAGVGGGRFLFTGEKVQAQLGFCFAAPLFEISSQPVSREYNRLEEGPCLAVQQQQTGFASLAAVFALSKGAGPPLRLREAPVHLAAAGSLLPREKAQALEIFYGEEQWTLLFCHQEVIAEVDLLAVGSHTGYGRVLVFGAGCENGLCLAW